VTAPGEYRGRSLKKGTRMIRMRSARRLPQQGQPERPVTHPGIPHAEREGHTCSECFGPRNRYREGQFCYQCEKALFGDGSSGYGKFVRSERQRRAEAAKRRASGPQGDLASRKERKVAQDTGTTLPWRQMVLVDRLIPNPDNPREDPGDLSELADSIKAAGLKQQLLVTPAPGRDGYYYIEDGWRRWLAMKDWATAIPCTVVPPAKGREQSVRYIVTSLVTSAHRLDLNAVEKARAYGRLRDEFGLSQAQIAAQTGLSVSSVGNYLALLELSQDTQDRVAKGSLQVGEALRAVRRRRAASRRRNGGTGRAGAVWEADWLAITHPLAEKAARLCNKREHNSRRRIGARAGYPGACGQCWESEIRRDEQLVIDANRMIDGERETLQDSPGRE
jgi:ParB/RepB/Spo0J family partition protein